MGMLRAITELVAQTEVIHQCAVEESMACGIGICMTCVLPVRNEDGSTSMLRSCIDGPVMDGSHVQWDLVGRIPEAHPKTPKPRKYEILNKRKLNICMNF
jgi:dihydroorotate dehydrogenase electron transfer subunit